MEGKRAEGTMRAHNAPRGPPLSLHRVYTYVYASVPLKGNTCCEWEKDRYPLFTIYNPGCWLLLADYRVVSVVHGLQWHQRQALERIVGNLIRWIPLGKTLFDHSKGKQSCSATVNTRTLERKSSRNVKLANGLRRGERFRFSDTQIFFPIRDSLIVFRIR